MSRSTVAAATLDRLGLLNVARRGTRWRGVVVLNHHRIGDAHAASGDPAVFSATMEELDAQLALLSRHAELIAPEDLAAARAVRSRCVMVTFDDGYADSLTGALPVLRAHGVRAAFFVITGQADCPRLPWWDELWWIARKAGTPELGAEWIARHKRLPVAEAERELEALAARTGVGRAPDELGNGLWLDWDGVRALREAGMEIGAHTHTHPVLARLPADEQAAEVALSAERIEAETGTRPRWFAYPVGTRDAVNADSRRAVRAAGFELAFTFFGGGAAWDSWDPLAIPRIWPSANLSQLRAEVTLPARFARGI